MKKLIIGSMAVAGLLLASCGSDGGSAATSAVDQVLDKLASTVRAEGGTLDRDCAKEQLDAMNAGDLATLSTADLGTDITLSDEGEAIGEAITACVSMPTDATDTASTDTASTEMGDGTASAGTVDISGMSTDDLREELVRLVTTSMAGMTVDEQCVRDAVGKLSDDDLRAIVQAGEEGDPQVSAEADEIGTSLVECVTDFGDDIDTSGDGSVPSGIEMTDALVDVFVEQLEASGVQADRPCIEQALQGIEVAELTDVMNNAELMSAITACITP